MVKPGRKYAVLALLLSGLALLGGGAWLIGTDSGARALLAGVSRWSPLQIEVTALDGRLADELRLDGVRLRWPGGEAATPSLRLHWQPWQLFRQEVAIEELTLGEVTITLQPGPTVAGGERTTTAWRWPEVSGLPRRLHGRIAALQLAGLTLHRDAAETRYLGPLTGRLDWQDGILRLSRLQARTPSGTLSGEAAAGLITPSLVLHLRGATTETPLREGRLDLDLQVGSNEKILTGPLALEVQTAKKKSGDLGGTITLDWSGPLTLTTTLQGRDLDPALLSPALSGELNLELTSTLRLPDHGPRQLKLVARLHDSLLRGHPLTGAVDAELTGDDLHLRQLELRGEGVKLTATGRLQERIDFALTFRALERLLPAASGSGAAAGWLRWQDGEFTGKIAGHGEKLAYADRGLDRATLQLQRPTPDGPFDLSVELAALRYRQLRLDHLTLDGGGRPQEHRLRLALQWPQGRGEIEVSGGYAPEDWKGRILRLEGKDEKYGAWRLAAPVDLLIGGTALHLPTLTLSSDQGERLLLAGDYDRETGVGTMRAEWNELKLARAAPWLPPTFAVAGTLSGSLIAELFPDATFAVTGKGKIADGHLAWAQKQGKVGLGLRQAELGWRWQKTALDLDLSLRLAEHGEISGNLSLPLPAALPVALTPTGPLRGEVKGRFQERGLLAALLPGVLHESHGDLALDLRFGGSWQEPELTGNLKLSKAGAYLPQVGITLRELSLQAEFAGDKVRIPAFKVASGKGELTGEGEVRLQQRQVAEYSGKLGGKGFLTINLPELRVVASPALTVSGTPQLLKVRGEIRLPELLVRGRQSQAPRRQHPDVLIVDAPPAEKGKAPLALDLEVRLVLGERALVDLGGIDARLGGNVLVTARGNEAVSGRGAIRVVKGAYAAYGMKLDISNGTLLFAGGPIDQPTLDILALRKTGEVQAGVKVGGTPRAPTVKLYSVPAMPDTDILSYIVLGRPMGSDAGQADLLSVAAGALLAKGESAVLQDRLRRRVGLDVIDVQSGDGDLTTSVITVGKYLNPRLYVSLGHSLFTESNIVGLRYNIGEHWQTESTVGEESGVDLFYKIEFR